MAKTDLMECSTLMILVVELWRSCGRKNDMKVLGCLEEYGTLKRMNDRVSYRA